MALKILSSSLSNFYHLIFILITCVLHRLVKLGLGCTLKSRTRARWLTRCAKRTSITIFGQWHGFSSRTLTSALLLSGFVSLPAYWVLCRYWCRWYVSSFGTKFTNSLFILISKHPQQQIILYKDWATAFMFDWISLCLTGLAWSMQTMEWHRSPSSGKRERQQLFISLHLEKLERCEVHLTPKLVSFFRF